MDGKNFGVLRKVFLQEIRSGFHQNSLNVMPNAQTVAALSFTRRLIKAR
jgi:hypothetical protein